MLPKHLCPGRCARSARSDPAGRCGHVQSDRPGRSGRAFAGGGVIRIIPGLVGGSYRPL